MSDMRFRRRPVRLLSTIVLAAFTAVTAAAACTPAVPAAKAPVTRTFGKAIEEKIAYESAAKKCRPADAFDKPGPIALRNLLVSTYGLAVGGRTVYNGISRPCDGSLREHHEGRALDWGMDYRNVTMRADGKAVLAWLFATDAYGNRDAIARRLGIMYVIWNKQIYGSWSGYTAEPYTCGTDPTACHVDHMHFSLDWPGARAQTSFFTGRVAAS